jgi:molybdate transport system substrate-binding protein
MRAWTIMVAAAASMGALVLTTPVSAAEIVLLSSTAMRESLEDLVPAFEKASGHKVTIIFKSGVDVTAALRAGDQADVAVSTDTALDELVKEGKIVANSRVDFARPRVGVAVRQGAAKPDISTADGLRKTLLAAKSIGYSKGPSGIHLEGVMKQLGVFDQVKAKLIQPALGVRVGSMVARGEAEIGVQQVNELLPIPGIDFVGPLPKELQPALVYSLAVPATAKERAAAAALVKFLTSEAALPVFKKLGLDPS